jgi:hypothetical protein
VWYHRFSPERWREARAGRSPDQCDRDPLVDHLIGSYLQVGQITREEVLELLGKENAWTRKSTDGCLRYVIGVYDGSDFHNLLACFDEKRQADARSPSGWAFCQLTFYVRSRRSKLVQKMRHAIKATFRQV